MTRGAESPDRHIPREDGESLTDYMQRVVQLAYDMGFEHGVASVRAFEDDA